MSTNEGSNPSDSTTATQLSTGRSSRFFRMGIFLVLIVLGLFTGFVGQLFSSNYRWIRMFFSLVLSVSWLLLFVWFLLLIAFLVMPVVRKEQIVEEWNVLIQGANGRASQIIEQTRELIVNSKAPKIAMEEKDIAPGYLRGAIGDSRPFLVVTNRTNANLISYRMYMNARDYGDSLQVSWYVIRSPSIFQTLFALSLLVPGLNLLTLPLFFIIRVLPRIGQAGLIDLDFFDLQDLKAYVTNAHHCVLEAVDKLLLDLSQDPSKIDRRSRGFLGIS